MDECPHVEASLPPPRGCGKKAASAGRRDAAPHPEARIVTLQPQGLWDQCPLQWRPEQFMTPPRGVPSHPRPPAAACPPGSCGRTHHGLAPASWRCPGPWLSPPAPVPQDGLPGPFQPSHWGAGQSRLTTGLPAEPLCPHPCHTPGGDPSPLQPRVPPGSQALPACIATPSRGQTPNPLSPSQSKRVGTAAQPGRGTWLSLGLATPPGCLPPGKNPPVASVCARVTRACPQSSLPAPGCPGAGLLFLIWGGGPEGRAQRHPGHWETGAGGEQPEPPGQGMSRALLT